MLANAGHPDLTACAGALDSEDSGDIVKLAMSLAAHNLPFGTREVDMTWAVDSLG